MQAGDLQKACAIARDDPGTDLVPTQADFQERVQSLAAQLLQVLITSSSFCVRKLAQSQVTFATLDCEPAAEGHFLRAGQTMCCYSRFGPHCTTLLVDNFLSVFLFCTEPACCILWPQCSVYHALVMLCNGIIAAFKIAVHRQLPPPDNL